ncbi:MAG TPA: succinylglutamate-semialdehyde dehydrogenase [Solimonas sp.]|nr:succinylglutamate-semialdehyde dehydrogenase [Solimonas sp.]
MSRSQLYIDGQWRDGQGPRFHREDPAHGRRLWDGASAAPADVDAAFAAAREAFAGWSSLPLAEREAQLRAYGGELETHKEALASTIAEEVGKPLWEARTEVAAMIGKIELSIRAYHQRTGESTVHADVGRHVLRHKPHGVVAVFGPYNFPGHLPNGHIVPALLAGNTVLFKPSELTPATAEKTLECWAAAGLPAGVLNLLQGERATGEAIAAHAQLDGLFFTGSSRTGALLARQFADRPGLILALEMGGNNPLILRPVADLDAAVHDIVQSAWLTSGQRCTCARRLLVPAGDWGDTALARLVEVATRIEVGAWDAQPAPFMGPLVSARAAEALLRAQDALLAQGAQALLPMRTLDSGPAFLTPGLIDVSDVAALPDEEYFGPLLQVQRYGTLDEAIALANRTRYGLSAGLIGEDEAEHRQCWQQLRAGILNWNRPTTGASGAFPFGGVGASGNHRASAWYAADYCAYPVASAESPAPQRPKQLAPGLHL